MIRFGVYQLAQKDDGLGSLTETDKLVYEGYGYLDMMTGSNQNINQNSLVVQATHILIVPDIPTEYNSLIPTDSIIRINHQDYRVTYVDNPVNIDHHLEIYLKEEQDGH